MQQLKHYKPAVDVEETRRKNSTVFCKLADSALPPWFYAQRCVKTLRTIHIATSKHTINRTLILQAHFKLQQLKRYTL